MFLITGATGKTGSSAVARLLAKKQPVRALVRSEQKGQTLREKGAQIAVGSLEDPASLGGALDGVRGVYFIVPPDPSTTDMIGRGRRIVDIFVAALRNSTVEHVVLLSSIGSQHPTGTGPIQMLHYAENQLAAAAKRLTSVRAAYFMENAAPLVGLMKGQGILPSFFDPARAIPMIATVDIGVVAADALLAPPAANEIIDLEGPTPLSNVDVAAAFSEVLGRKVTAVPVPLEGVAPALMQAGFSQNVAEVYREMSEAVGKGLLTFGGGSRHVRGSTTIARVAKQAAG